MTQPFLNLPIDPFGPCLFKILSGIPCPTCGMSRSLICLIQGDWLAAWHYHPFLPIAIALGPALLMLRASGRIRLRMFSMATWGIGLILIIWGIRYGHQLFGFFLNPA